MYHLELGKNDKNKKKRSSTPNLTGIPLQIKSKFEHVSGFSFDDVRVHYNSNEPAKVQALAYTMGNHVYMGSGQEKHLNHELGHVVQQKAGMVQPTASIGGFLVNDDPKLEQKADRIGMQPIQRKKPPVVQRLRIRLDNDPEGNDAFAAIRRININPNVLNESVSIIENQKLNIDKSSLIPTEMGLKTKMKEEMSGNINNTAASKRLQKHFTPNIPVSMSCCDRLWECLSCSKDPYYGYGPEKSGTHTLKMNEDIIFEGHGTTKGLAKYDSKELAKIAYDIIKKCGYTKERPWKGRVILLGCEGGSFAKDVATTLNSMANFKICALGPDRDFAVLIDRVDANYGLGKWIGSDNNKPINYKEINDYTVKLYKYLGTLLGACGVLHDILDSLKVGRKNIRSKRRMLSLINTKIHSNTIYKEKQPCSLEYLERDMPERLKDVALKEPMFPKMRPEEIKLNLPIRKKGEKFIKEEMEEDKEWSFDEEEMEDLDAQVPERVKTTNYQITKISIHDITKQINDEVSNILDYLNWKVQVIDLEDAMGRLKLLKADIDTISLDYFDSCGVRINFDTEEGIIKEEVGEDVLL